MYKKLAVAIIHGIGEQTEEYAEKTIVMIRKKFSKKLKNFVEDPSSQLIFEAILWSKTFSDREQSLLKKTVLGNRLRYQVPRNFVIKYVGDVIAYQPVESAGHNYEKVHETIGNGLNVLAKEA